MDSPATATALEVRHLSKTFPGTRALDCVDLVVRAGMVNALVGHNGSGKSTLVKVLSGHYVPDPGSEIWIAGQELLTGSPEQTEQLGLRVVHQELGLVDSLSVTENVAMGAGFGVSGLRRISWREENRFVAEHMSRLGYEVDPTALVGALPAATRTAVAIVRALLPRPGRSPVQVLLLDEVTATMPETEIRRLLELVVALRSQGVAILYISHHLEEVLQVADVVTVLRDGERVACSPATEFNQDTLADAVVGGTEWREHLSRTAQVPGAEAQQQPLLEVHDVDGPTVRGISFSAGPGCIVGVAGITGSGRDEVAEMLSGGLDRGGSVKLDGQAVTAGDPKHAMKLGMSLVPAERLASAVIPTQSVRENVCLSGRFRRRGLTRIDAVQERRDVHHWITKLTIRGASVDGSLLTLSGGNQQKAIFARCLAAEPKAVILDEPTQGVDVGSVAEIHSLIREISQEAAVVICSSDNYELATLCAVVLVLHRGKVIGTLSGAEVTEENIDRLQLSNSEQSSSCADVLETAS